MSTADRLLHLLKTRGALRAADIAQTLGVTASAVRQHLAELEAGELVAFEDRREGTGRPKRYWHLAARGHARFPDTHEQLTTELLRAARAVFGDDGVERLIEERERAMEQGYRKALRGARTTFERVERLARLRSSEGYMAACEAAPDGSVLLVENHCPICAAASACEGFCRSELDIFRRVLGARVDVQREDHMLAGARRCAYRIRSVAAVAPHPKPRRLV